MKRAKALFVTLLVAAMAILIILGLYRMSLKAFQVIMIIFAVWGFLAASVSFCRWLAQGTPMLPAESEAIIYDSDS